MGKSRSQGQPPSRSSIKGTRQPRSLPSPASSSTRPAPSPPQSQSAEVPRCQACQRCQAMPGRMPISSVGAAEIHRQCRHSRPSATAARPAAAVGNSSGAFSSSIPLAARPVSKPIPAGWRARCRRNKPIHSTAITVSCVPSSIASRPWRAIGSSVSRMALVARQLSRSPGRSCHCSNPPSGTIKLESNAGAMRIVHSEGRPCGVVRPISVAMIRCSPGALLRYGSFQRVGSNKASPLP